MARSNTPVKRWRERPIDIIVGGVILAAGLLVLNRVESSTWDPAMDLGIAANTTTGGLIGEWLFASRRRRASRRDHAADERANEPSS